MQAIANKIQPLWKPAKIVSNRSSICLKLRNLPEWFPILCVVELIELPFLPRTTEAQETLGSKPQTMALCLKGAHSWGFTHKHVQPLSLTVWLEFDFSTDSSCICLSVLIPTLYPWIEHTTHTTIWEPFFFFFLSIVWTWNTLYLSWVPSHFRHISRSPVHIYKRMGWKSAKLASSTALPHWDLLGKPDKERW